MQSKLLLVPPVLIFKNILEAVTSVWSWLVKPLARQVNCCLLNFLSASFNVIQSWWKCCLSVKQVGSGWDAELVGVSSRSKLFSYWTTVVLGGLKVNMALELLIWSISIILLSEIQPINPFSTSAIYGVSKACPERLVPTYGVVHWSTPVH